MATALTSPVIRWTGDPARDHLALTAAGHDLVLDLSAVDTLDHDGLALLVRARQHLRRDGGHLCLAAPSRLILTVLHTMRLEQAFPTFADVDAALAWLATGVASSTRAPLWAEGLVTS